MNPDLFDSLKLRLIIGDLKYFVPYCCVNVVGCVKELLSAHAKVSFNMMVSFGS